MLNRILDMLNIIAIAAMLFCAGIEVYLGCTWRIVAALVLAAGNAWTMWLRSQEQ